jgi:hypothetical protein
MNDAWDETLRQACPTALATQERVRVDARAIVAVARDRVGPDDLQQPTWSVAGDPGSDPETQAAWILAYNAVNFSYYPDPGARRWAALVGGDVLGQDDEALGVMGGLGAAMGSGVRLQDASVLSGLDADGLSKLLPTAPGHDPLPLHRERLVGLRELGAAYALHGGPLGLIARGGGDAAATVSALVEALPGWEDVRELGGHRLPFRKRAQLCVAMLHARERAAGREGFSGMDRLTVFADYRLPQILRAEGVMLVAPDLAARIEEGQPLALGGEDEVAIRAATVAASEALAQALRPRFPKVDALLIDNLLWRRAVERDGEIPAFHRTRCTDY